MGDPLRVPRAPTPKFLALGRVVAGEAIATRYQQFRPIVERQWNRGGIRFLRFFARIIGTAALPQFLAGLRVEGEQERINGTVRAPSAVHGHVALEDL